MNQIAPILCAERRSTWLLRYCYLKGTTRTLTGGASEFFFMRCLLDKLNLTPPDFDFFSSNSYSVLLPQPPFTHQNRKKLQQRIISDNVKLPPYLSSEAHSLLKGVSSCIRFCTECQHFISWVSSVASERSGEETGQRARG